MATAARARKQRTGTIGVPDSEAARAVILDGRHLGLTRRFETTVAVHRG